MTECVFDSLHLKLLFTFFYLTRVCARIVIITFFLTRINFLKVSLLSVFFFYTIHLNTENSHKGSSSSIISIITIFSSCYNCVLDQYQEIFFTLFPFFRENFSWS